MSGEPTPLEKLKMAVQEYAQSQEEQAILVDTSVVMFEMVYFDDDGHTRRRISYAVPTDNYSLSSSVGLLTMGITLVEGDLLGEDDE